MNPAPLPWSSADVAAEENAMNFNDPHIQPVIALVAGVLVLLMPRLLNYIVALALIIYGLVGLNAIYKFVGG
jgi:Protein of unknown function (DUF3096)